MANLKSITELPVASSSNGVNLIINDNGAAKQIAASAVGAQADWAETNENSPAFIKNKPGSSKELAYEWTPGIDEDGNPITDVDFFVQNIDDDMTWLTNKMDDCDFEIVLEQYACYEDSDSGDMIIDTNIEHTIMFGSGDTGCAYAMFVKDNSVNIEMVRANCQGFMPYWSADGIQYQSSGASIAIYNKMQFNMDNNSPIYVTTGGCIMIESYPIKSIKIYKITY